MYTKRGNVKITKIVSDLRDAIVDLKKVVNLSTEDDRSFCRNMFCKFKSVVVFFKILTCLLSSRSYVDTRLGSLQFFSSFARLSIARGYPIKTRPSIKEQ